MNQKHWYFHGCAISLVTTVLHSKSTKFQIFLIINSQKYLIFKQFHCLLNPPNIIKLVSSLWALVKKNLNAEYAKCFREAILPYETYKHLCSLPWTRSCHVGGWDLYERLEEYTQPCKGPRLPIFNVLLLSPYQSSPREIWLCEPGRVSSNFYMRQFRLGAFRTTQHTEQDSKCVFFSTRKKRNLPLTALQDSIFHRLISSTLCSTPRDNF